MATAQDIAQRAGAPLTYRTLDEQAGKLSPAEERFERLRRDIGLVLGGDPHARRRLVDQRGDPDPGRDRLSAATRPLRAGARARA